MLDTSLQDQMEHIFFNSSFDNFIYLFIFGCAGSSLLCGLFSNCSEEELLCCICGLLILVFSCCRIHALGSWASVIMVSGLSSCGSQTLQKKAKYLWHTGLVALQHVGSSWTRNRTHVSCTCRQILHH